MPPRTKKTSSTTKQQPPAQTDDSLLPKEPIISQQKDDSPENPPSPLPRAPHLSVDEKRRWLARIVRDTSGQHQGFELGLADKFKAIIEDNKLADHPPNSEETISIPSSTKELPALLRTLLTTVHPPHAQRFSP